MNQWIRKNFGTLAVVSAAAVIVGLSFGAAGNTCPVAEPLKGQLDTNTQKTGETVMLTATKQDGKVNVDHSPQLAARYGINSIPSLKVFEEGEVVDEHVGLANKGRLKKMLGI